MMKLRHAAASPFVRKVMVLLHETGQVDEVELEDGATSPLDPNPGNLAVNPLGKIPCLVTEEGAALYDSRVITRYLDARHAGAKLYPEGEALWPALVMEATGDAMMEAAVGIIYERRLREEAKRSEAWMAAQRGKIAQAMDKLESARFGDALDMGQVSIACALGYLDFRFPEWDWRSGRGSLAAFARRMEKRPSFLATAPA
ncbi:MAG: glutathione S-transferase N-terminal domain-containing protein [Albimonas sp.]|uniref:glutathione S-transferase N-terminal domain-containing protein n=1 Tax=Albimonas sp. TaxID=1872425 RepID=UPI004055F0BD|tara:strand:+ start:196 stop:798 length:603 start_codon:yes stop_codon:yes gene_type:complete